MPEPITPSAKQSASQGVNGVPSRLTINTPIQSRVHVEPEPEEDTDETPVRRYSADSIRRAKRVAVQKFKGEAQEFLGDEFDVDGYLDEINKTEQLEEIASTEVNTPSFPFIIFGIALFLDLVDIGDFTIIVYLVMLIVKIIFAVILWFWMLGKMSSMFKFGSKMGTSIIMKQMAKKAVTVYASRRLLAVFLINLIPIIGILASNAWFVWIAHNRMKKWAQTYIFLVESAGKQLKDMERR